MWRNRCGLSRNQVAMFAVVVATAEDIMVVVVVEKVDRSRLQALAHTPLRAVAMVATVGNGKNNFL